LHGCRIILRLDKACQAAREDPSLKAMYDFILELCMVPVMQMVERWMTQGHLLDPFKEFFIVEAEKLTKQDLLDDFNSTYWHEKFTLLTDSIPAVFLQKTGQMAQKSLADKALLAGKYLNVLRECSHPLADQPLQLHLKFDASHLDYFIAKIDVAYEEANKILLKLLIDKYDLYGKLESVKNVYLMEYGDVFSHLLDTSYNLITKKVSDVQIDRLQAALEACFKAGTSRNDPYCTTMNQYQVTMSSTSLTDQLMKIANMSAEDTTSSQPAPEKDNAAPLTGLLALNLDCPVDFPLSILLSFKSMTKYQMLFRHLFSLSCLTRQLNQCLIPQSLPTIRLLETRFDILEETMSRMRALKSKMTFFLNVLNQYFHMDVLMHHWSEWHGRWSKLSTVEDFMSGHAKFLDSCLKEALLTNWKLFRILSKLFTNCSIFTTLCHKMEKDLSGMASDAIDGTYLRHQQHSMTRQSLKIETNFVFHIKLFIHTLQFHSTTDFDHRIGALIFQLESAFENLDQVDISSGSVPPSDPFK
jgi:gamma-tubulin complex component 2